jgi:toxin ParE1/3/4
VTPTVGVEAERELIEGALFYAREASPDLGLAFIAEFERMVGLLCRRPRVGPVWRGTTRRLPLRRFPYSIIYQLTADEVRVIALAHQSRRPGYWRGRQ